MSTKNRPMTLAASAVVLVLWGSSVSQAAPPGTAANRQQYLKALAGDGGAIAYKPPARLSPRLVAELDRAVRRYGIRRPPAIPGVVRNAPRAAIIARRKFILERYRRLALRNGNGRAFGGVYPAGATLYVPTEAINIPNYFPVFRL